MNKYTHLHRLADGPTLPVLDILAALLGHVLALLPGHLLVGGLLLLSAVLDRLLGALLGGLRLVDSLLHVAALLLGHAAAALGMLLGEASEGEDEARDENNLHLEKLGELLLMTEAELH